MKRILFGLLLALALVPCAAGAQTIAMEAQGLTFDYPESWIVVSPQLAKVYAPLLEDAGIDAQALGEELADAKVQSRAYSADYAQCMSIVAFSDDLSEEIYDIERVTDSQRRTMKSRAESGALFETTGMRVQDTAWQKEGGLYWLYIHYTKTRADATIGRGVRYVTVRNGMYIVLDWQKTDGRFTNKELSAFRAQTANLTVTQSIPEPMRTVSLTAQIPTETNTAEITISGKTEAGATLLAQAPDAKGDMQTLSVGVAGTGGSFALLVQLEDEGSYDLTLTASVEGTLDASVSGTVAYSAKTLPVSLVGAQEDGMTVVTSDSVTISGQTLAGTQMQLVSPKGLTKKSTGNDGSFSFELTTKEAGEYDYTLILSKSGYDQRRVRFTLVRQLTDSQEHEAVKKSAEAISYKNLQKNLEENLGKTLVIYGPVTEISAAGSNVYLRMQYNKKGDGTWYNPVVVVADADTGIREGDMATLAVTVAGVFEEQDEQGNPVMIPHLQLLFVDKVE